MTEVVVSAHGTHLAAAPTGPRITGFRHGDGADLLARLPDTAVIERGGGPPYRFGGGHRLWVAPEVPAVTYAPDDHRVEVVAGAGTVTLTAPPDSAGIAKSITATVTAAGRARIDHAVTNASSGELTLAPWAITQLRTGGTALLPLGAAVEEAQAERNLVAWSYTRLDDPLLDITRTLVTLRATRGDATKVGTTLRRRWLAYALDGTVLVKRPGPAAPGPLADLGATGQMYCNHLFVELETLGPLVALAPGESASHTETWELHTVPAGMAPAAIVDELRLDADEGGP